MEETISLQEIIKILKKHMGLILATTIGAGVIAAIISFFILTPIYQANTQILVSQQSDNQQNLTTNEIQSNLQLINTYNVIIKSPAILSIVIDDLDLDTTPGGLTNKITVSNANNSQVVNISVQDEQEYMAVDIANTVAEVFQKEIPKLMNVDNVNVLSAAVYSENPSPVKPNKMLNIAIALIVGLMIGVGIAVLLEFLDVTVKTESEIEELLGLPVLGMISTIKAEDLGEASSSEIRSFRNRGQS
ncbi:MAG: Wzz/FepE/Etk N-terminal domain-containing protein [Solibacillus sp.]